MFTGIIEEIGAIEAVAASADGRHFTISARRILEDLKPDDSVSVDGVCLTATEVSDSSFKATAVKETLSRTTLGDIRKGTKVNLERALRLNDRLGGHIVQGHVDGMGTVTSVHRRGTGYEVSIQLPSKLVKYALDKGSIAVNGISLTIAALRSDQVTVAVIPHTWEHTTLYAAKTGSKMNIETDFLGKYVERLILHRDASPKDENWLRSLGYE